MLMHQQDHVLSLLLYYTTISCEFGEIVHILQTIMNLKQHRKMMLAMDVLKMLLSRQTSTSSKRHNITLNQMHVTQ